MVLYACVNPAMLKTIEKYGLYPGVHGSCFLTASRVQARSMWQAQQLAEMQLQPVPAILEINLPEDSLPRAQNVSFAWQGVAASALCFDGVYAVPGILSAENITFPKPKTGRRRADPEETESNYVYDFEQPTYADIF